MADDYDKFLVSSAPVPASSADVDAEAVENEEAEKAGIKAFEKGKGKEPAKKEDEPIATEEEDIVSAPKRGEEELRREEEERRRMTEEQVKGEKRGKKKKEKVTITVLCFLVTSYPLAE